MTRTSLRHKVEGARFVGVLCAIWFLVSSAWAIVGSDPFDGAQVGGIDVWYVHQGGVFLLLVVILGYLLRAGQGLEDDHDGDRA